MNKKKYNLLKDFVKKYPGVVLTIAIFTATVIYSQVEFLMAQYQLEKGIPSEIVDIANNTGMSLEGKSLFYKANPQIVDSDEYEKYCYEGEDVKERLSRGCVVTDSSFGTLVNTKIYLRKLNNPDYADAIYDTAAHEMLHIAYKRLSSSEKSEVHKILDKELEHYHNDPRISLFTDDSGRLSTISYEEFYSVLGSYYHDVSEELEEHFKKYFRDRDVLLKIGEASLYRSRLDEAARYRHQAEMYQKTMNDISEKINSSAEKMSRAERAKLEAQLRELGIVLSDAWRKHDEVGELLE